MHPYHAIRENYAINCAIQGAPLIWSLTNQNAWFVTSFCTELTLFLLLHLTLLLHSRLNYRIQGHFWRLISFKWLVGSLVDSKVYNLHGSSARQLIPSSLSRTELNNEATTSLACGKQRGFKRARPKNAFDSRIYQCRVLNTKTFFFLFKTYSHFERFRGQKLFLKGLGLCRKFAKFVFKEKSGLALTHPRSSKSAFLILLCCDCGLFLGMQWRLLLS